MRESPLPNQLPGDSPSASPTPAGDLLALPAGYALNEYRIERVLGWGGFGVTYLARDSHLDCPVAIKEYLPRAAAGRGPEQSVCPHSEATAQPFEWGLQRFLLESRALASFHHAGIVRVLRYFRANDTAYMVMEYETGEPLSAWLAGRLPVDQATLLRLLRPLLDGLEAIHAAGFLHRDINPRNIYIRADGSPVLLDFGSARRLAVDGQEQMMTAVVTPGFAPAEQYYPDGKQGPWTDLYALAGVLYWLVTGQRPSDALARLREDTMPSASAIGNVEVFGGAMLRTIDWALSPDEGHRPRRVADFRRACLPAVSGEAAVSPAQSVPPAGAALAAGCSFIGAVLFADVTAAEPAAAAEHKERRSLLATLLSQAVAALPASNRLAVNTSEGCAVAYLGDPEDALRTARHLGAAAASRDLALQMGINLGPVRVLPSPSGRSRILGDGITTAYRVMRFADPGQVLASSVYVDLIRQLRHSAAGCFLHLGQRQDPQERQHEVYLYSGEGDVAASVPLDSASAGSVTGAELDPETVDAAERLLSRHIGPMARIIVRKTLPRAGSREELHRLLAGMIPDPAAQAAFLAAVPAASPPASAGTPPSSQRVASAAVSAAPKTATVAPAGVPAGSAFADADLERIGKIFARHIGPLAKVLLRRESAQAGDLDSLYRALARHIDHEDEQRRFLRDAGHG
jgi:serine/threonine protein kinase